MNSLPHYVSVRSLQEIKPANILAWKSDGHESHKSLKNCWQLIVSEEESVFFKSEPLID